MVKHLGLLLLLGALAGCQMDEQVDAATQRPNLAPPGYAQSPRPLPGQPRTSVYQGQTPSPALRPYDNPKSSYDDRRAATGAIPRAWIPQAKAVAWKYVVVHHSDTKVGGAVAFDRGHRARGWDSLGYNFVIGNGTYTRDGEIEVGPRWVRQTVGAHAGVEEFNKWGIGICLVGDFENSKPTPAQLKSLAYLTGYLQRTYRIPANMVLGHRDCKKGHTLCPGRYLDMNLVRKMAAQYAGIDERLMPGQPPLAIDANLPAACTSADQELLQDVDP